eukprot:TRINITY_DN2263_c1_g2_i5.p1 TRINITY_DN2263_c1_g2~~TRINITY_DN2263_c1_g2_i5.p1  ORF type:complete len:341 (+),score=8.97 TRINITY_DN2263_c1_g2_i5:283-1305(+)
MIYLTISKIFINKRNLATMQSARTRLPHIVCAASSDRQMCLIGSVRLTYLDSSLAGDFGLDPLNLGSEPDLIGLNGMQRQKKQMVVGPRWRLQELWDKNCQNAKDWVKYHALSVKQGKLQPMSLIERRIRAATSNEIGGPVWTQEIVDYCFEDANKWVEVFAVLCERLDAPNYKWRRITKGLKILYAIISRMEITAALSFMDGALDGFLDMSQNFVYVDEQGLDQGIRIRRLADCIVYEVQERFRQELLMTDLFCEGSLFFGPEVQHRLQIPTVQTEEDIERVNNEVCNMDDDKLIEILKVVDKKQKCADCKVAVGIPSAWATAKREYFICVKCADKYRE